MGNKWNDNWLEDARDVGLTTLGKAGLIGAALGTLVFGAYAACKGERAALDGETPGKQYALDILTHGAKGGLILGQPGHPPCAAEGIKGGKKRRP